MTKKDKESMTFFLAFLQGKPGHPIPAYNFWQYYLKKGIEEAGHRWVECSEADWAQGIVLQPGSELSGWKSKTWEKTIQYLQEHPVDVFLSYLYPEQVDRHALGLIRGMGIPCVNFYCDHVRQFKSVPHEFQYFDLNWVPEFDALNMYKKAGYKYIHLPMPAWVEASHRSPGQDRLSQVSFIGSKDVQRDLLFGKAFTIDPALDVHLYGAGWTKAPYTQAGQADAGRLLNQFRFIHKQGIRAYIRKIGQKGRGGTSNIPKDHIHTLLDNEEYIDLSRNSLVTLGVNRFPSFRFPLNRPGSYSRLRDIEAPMLGACYLTEYAPGLEMLYEIDREIACYRTPEELVEQCRKLLTDTVKRHKLRAEGQKRALHDHSIAQSIRKILAFLS